MEGGGGGLGFAPGRTGRPRSEAFFNHRKCVEVRLSSEMHTLEKIRNEEPLHSTCCWGHARFALHFQVLQSETHTKIHDLQIDGLLGSSENGNRNKKFLLTSTQIPSEL